MGRLPILLALFQPATETRLGAGGERGQVGAGTSVEGRDEAAARRLDLAYVIRRYPPIADALRRNGLAACRLDGLVAEALGGVPVVHLIGLEEGKGLVFPAERAGEVATLGIERAQALVVERPAAPGEEQHQHKLGQEKTP